MLIQVTCPDGGKRYVNAELSQQVLVWNGATRIWFGGDDEATVSESPEEIVALINAAQPAAIPMLEWTCEGVPHMVATANVIGIRQTHGQTYVDVWTYPGDWKQSHFAADQRTEGLIGQWKRLTGHTPASAGQ